MSPIVIDNRSIGPNHLPYIIAELSANHGGDLQRARRIVQMAAECGADAIKFQAYTADSLTLDCDMPDFVIASDNPWKGRRLYDLYAEAATPYDWFPELFAYARKLGITPFASPFDTKAVAMLENLEAPAYKIASFEAVDVELIAACAATGKPVIVSTGLCSLEDIEDVVKTFRQAGGRELALLVCSSAYPSDPKELNLSVVADMAVRFGVPTGFSDHTLGAAVAIAACAMGACIVEKHVIDSRTPPTADSAFSALPEELADLVTGCRTAFLARGRVDYGLSEREKQSTVFRRSLYAVRDIDSGEAFTDSNVRSIRPGYGLLPKEKPNLKGRRANRRIMRGEPLSWELVE